MVHGALNWTESAPVYGLNLSQCILQHRNENLYALPINRNPLYAEFTHAFFIAPFS